MRSQYLLTLVMSGAALTHSSAQITALAPASTREDRARAVEKVGFPDFPPLPKSEVSLIGGVVTKVDPVRDRMMVRAFGGRDLTMAYDLRTSVLRGTTPVPMCEIRPGTRIYADTILNNGQIFAKTVRVNENSVLGEARGQVTEYDASKRLLRARDIISSQPLTLRLSSQTDIRSGNQALQASDLIAGTLVRIVFRSASDGPSAAEKIEILARPGSTYAFAGRIAVVDLRDSHLTLVETPGNGTFEVGLDSLPRQDKLRLKLGSDVIVHARFDGRRYQAQSIETTPSPQP